MSTEHKRDKDDKVKLQFIFDTKVPCLKCLKLRVDKKSEGLDCSCIAFIEFCFQWEKNAGVKGWDMKCFGFCGKETDMLDVEDDIHRYQLNKLMGEGKTESYAKNYINIMKSNQKLTWDQMVGLKELYYDETHPHLSGAPKNESCGRACKIIKKNPLLDGEMSGKSWKGVGSIDMSTYDSIEENKRKKREESKQLGTEDKSRELKGVRRVANGGKGKETKSSDTTVVTKDIAKSRKGMK